MQVRVEKTAETGELAGNRRKDKTDWETATERSGTPLVTKKRTVAWSSNGSKLKHEASTGRWLEEEERNGTEERRRSLQTPKTKQRKSPDESRQCPTKKVRTRVEMGLRHSGGGCGRKERKEEEVEEEEERRRGKRRRDIGRSLKRLVEWVVVLYLKGGPGTVYRRPSTAQGLGGRRSRDARLPAVEQRAIPVSWRLVQPATIVIPRLARSSPAHGVDPISGAAATC
ncbi:hypothetical protein S40293_10677 [Stachybotrys chartarum IBT 40293]|nr:hypothetical protein S40293_10677 [Stachybotrys chartarum IBT 40293]